MKYALHRLLLVGIVAAHTGAAQESRPGNAAQGVWFGAYVDDSPCARRPRDSSPVGVTSAILACSSAPVLYVLDFTVQGEEIVGTLTTGRPPPVTGSYAAMQRVLQDKEIEIPDALELRGTVEGNALSVATANDVILIDARIRRDRMDASVESETANGKETVRVRFEH